MSEQGKGNGLFRIGEVAKLFHLSISSLRHYETIGLVQPEYTDEMTGYRYYSVRQFEALNTIRYLRALDVGLKDIRGFLQHKDLGCMEELLEAQQRTVRQKLTELARIERKVGNRLAQCPAQRMIFLRADLQQPRSQDLEASIRQLEAEQQEALVFLGKIGLSISPERLREGNFLRYDGLFLLLDAEDRYAGPVVETAASPYAVLSFAGCHDGAPERYQRLMEFIRKENLTISGPAQEITLVDAGITQDASDFITEIRVPVKSGA